MRVRALGKVNIGLHILGKREDGYHNLETLLLPISLADELRMERADSFQVKGPHFGREDFMYRAYQQISKAAGRDLPVSIEIEKNIPVGAGLAGGTTDGAAVLRAINEIYELGYSQGELAEISAPLGADFPYTIYSRPALGEGVGNALTFLPTFEDFPLLLLNPGFSISTAQAYSLVQVYHSSMERENWMEPILQRDFEEMKRVYHNDLKRGLSCTYPILQEMEEALYREGANFASLSGSGPTVFGLFQDVEARNLAFHTLQAYYPYVHAADILGGAHDEIGILTD